MNLLCISGQVLNESLSSQLCFRKRGRPLLKISFSVILGLVSFIIVFSRAEPCSGGTSSKCCSRSVLASREFACDSLHWSFQRLRIGAWESYFFHIVIGNRLRTMFYLITIIIISLPDWIKIALIFYYKILCKNAVNHFSYFHQPANNELKANSILWRNSQNIAFELKELRYCVWYDNYNS